MENSDAGRHRPTLTLLPIFADVRLTEVSGAVDPHRVRILNVVLFVGGLLVAMLVSLCPMS